MLKFDEFSAQMFLLSLLESGATEIDQDTWKIPKSKHECANGCCREAESVQPSNALLHFLPQAVHCYTYCMPSVDAPVRHYENGATEVVRLMPGALNM